MNCNRGAYPKPTVRIDKDWSSTSKELGGLFTKTKLHTICAEGACPNIAECWSQKHAAFMVMGDVCTRRCTFCYVRKGRPGQLDASEPESLAQTVADMGLKHVVITSVTRDDLRDGGAGHFKDCIEAIRAKSPKTTIEILTPDFRRKPDAVRVIVDAKPDVFNHNIETVPRLYPTVRLGADYAGSLDLLKQIKTADSNIFTKSGLMLGLGESLDEVEEVMRDLRKHKVDFITIGQYLQPTPEHHEVLEYAAIETFELLKKRALELGFLLVSSTPLTRSSYHAGEDFERLRKLF